MYIFPGIGLGAILSNTRHVSDGMVERAAVALASSLNAEERAAGLVYPRLARIRDLSAAIALAVIRQAQKEVSGWCGVRTGLAIDTPPARGWTGTVISALFPTTTCWGSSTIKCGNHRRTYCLFPFSKQDSVMCILRREEAMECWNRLGLFLGYIYSGASSDLYI